MIKFGTDGWRAIIAEEYTFANVRLVSFAVAEYIQARSEKDKAEGREGVVVGYDARFLSKEFAHDAAAVLAEQGVKVWLSDSFLPTPALSWQVVDKKAACGVMITASHNPPNYNGYKIKAYYGGSAPEEIISAIEERVRTYSNKGNEVKKVPLSPKVECFSPQAEYLKHVQSMLNRDIISQYKGKIVFDMMHGSAQRIAELLGKEYGLDVVEFRGHYNPSFDGVNPEPAEKYLGRLKTFMQETQADFALATDGDGDRIGAMSADGTFISANQIMALLVKYLIEKRGWSGALIKTVTCSDIMVKVAEKYGRKLYETPVGFKYIADIMMNNDILIGGEESGGIGLKNYIPERDGILLGFLAIEVAAAYGKPLGELLKELMDEVGYFYYKREDVVLKREKKERLMAGLLDTQIDCIAGHEIIKYDKSDGVKLYLKDGGWVMFRASGTEPIIRIYAEASSRERLDMILHDAIRYVHNA